MAKWSAEHEALVAGLIEMGFGFHASRMHMDMHVRMHICMRMHMHTMGVGPYASRVLTVGLI